MGKVEMRPIKRKAWALFNKMVQTDLVRRAYEEVKRAETMEKIAYVLLDRDMVDFYVSLFSQYFSDEQVMKYVSMWCQYDLDRIAMKANNDLADRRDVLEIMLKAAKNEAEAQEAKDEYDEYCASFETEKKEKLDEGERRHEAMIAKVKSVFAIQIQKDIAETTAEIERLQAHLEELKARAKKF